MKRFVLICGSFVLCSVAWSLEQGLPVARPSEFMIGRHVFFDFGPPTDLYELIFVRQGTNGTSVQRITLTPPGQVCVQPARVELESASIVDSPEVLLGSKNPCTIPEKDLRREAKRCKNCLVFSGAEVVMQVQCGAASRLIRADILDKDMFDPAARTPENTSWTMRLWERLEKAVGPSATDNPMFRVEEKEEVTEKAANSETLRAIDAGKFDGLFKNAPDKLSELFRASQLPAPPPPSVRLMNSSPISPEKIELPLYPPIARLTRIEGTVTFTIQIAENGAATNLNFKSGHPLFRKVVEDAVSHWRFPMESAKQQVEATIEFALNCHDKNEKR